MGAVRIVTPEAVAAAVAALPPRPRVVVSGNFAAPWEVLRSIDAAVPEYTLFALNAQPGLPDREGVTLETCFVGPGMRHRANLRYVPARLSMSPLLFGTTLPPDVVVVHASAPHQGTVSLGIEVNLLPAAIEAAHSRGGLVVAQVNPHMPYTFGDGVYPLGDFDFVVEVEQPWDEVAPNEPDACSQEIGARVASLVPDGATLQMGIGAVPDAALHQLVDRRGLRIWTEMFSDGVLRLDAEGALDADAPLVASFLFGTADLYRWVDRNPRVRVKRTEKVNDPRMIAKNAQMVSVNSALQVDLFGQANASRIKARIYSGFGGQTDFTVGALHSPGGKAIMALRSWHPRADVSTIVPLIDEPVTSFQHSAVVTENGVAQIWGYSQQEQARHIVEEAAHPDVRDELWEEAEALGLT
jgi:acyl-CoA hydrolase